MRSIQPDDLIDERRLAGAVVAEDSDHLAGFHVHRDSVVRPNQARAGAEALVQAVHGENLFHRLFPSFRFHVPQSIYRAVYAKQTITKSSGRKRADVAKSLESQPEQGLNREVSRFRRQIGREQDSIPNGMLLVDENWMQPPT